MATKTRARSFPSPEPREPFPAVPQEAIDDTPVVSAETKAEEQPSAEDDMAPDFGKQPITIGSDVRPFLTDSLAEQIRGVLAPAAEGYCQKHIDLRIEPAIAEFLARLRLGLNERNVRLTNGRHVTSGADAARWLLEQCLKVTMVVVEVKP